MTLRAIRDYWHRTAAEIRATCHDLYRHYRLERDRIEQEDRVALRSHDDQMILAAVNQAHLRDRVSEFRNLSPEQIEAQVRRWSEASRFGRPRGTDHA